MTEPVVEPVTPPAAEPAAPQFAAITSQEDFDRRVQDRLARQKAQYKEFDTYKASHDELQQLQAASQTAQEKAEARAVKAEQTAADAVQHSVKAEVKAIATGEFADPSDAALYLGDLSRFIKDGETDADGIEAALKDVLKAKPHLAARATTTDVGLGTRSGTTAASPNQQMNDTIRRAAGRQ